MDMHVETGWTRAFIYCVTDVQVAAVVFVQHLFNNGMGCAIMQYKTIDLTMLM
jgi:hypothetical protein